MCTIDSFTIENYDLNIIKVDRTKCPQASPIVFIINRSLLIAANEKSSDIMATGFSLWLL